MKEKVFKCGYKNCLHGGTVEESVAIRKGNRYFHKDCLDMTEKKQEIRDLYLEKINQLEVVKNLNAVINNILDVKKASPDLLLFALKYAISHNFKINSPYGLHYIINNKKIQEEYYKSLQRQQKKQEYNIETVNTKESKFKPNVEKIDLWSRITGK